MIEIIHTKNIQGEPKVIAEGDVSVKDFISKRAELGEQELVFRGLKMTVLSKGPKGRNSQGFDTAMYSVVDNWGNEFKIKWNKTSQELDIGQKIMSFEAVWRDGRGGKQPFLAIGHGERKNKQPGGLVIFDVEPVDPPVTDPNPVPAPTPWPGDPVDAEELSARLGRIERALAAMAAELTS